MSKFDVTKARSEADWYLEYPDEDKRLTRFAMRMRAACNEVDALEARIAKLEKMREAAKAEARVAVLREALTAELCIHPSTIAVEALAHPDQAAEALLARPTQTYCDDLKAERAHWKKIASEFHGRVAVLWEALQKHGRDNAEVISVLRDNKTAAEALLAERDRLKDELACATEALDDMTQSNGAHADNALKLKAQLDVAVDTLHDVCDHHAGERSCRSVYSEPDHGPCDCHVDQARAALAKIKETP